MEDYLLDLIYKEMYKRESAQEKKEYLQNIIDKLEDVIKDINYNPWEYE